MSESSTRTIGLAGKASTPATALHAKPSAHFDAKLLQTQQWLQSAANDFSPLKQASSLGAEDVVITDLINRLQLPIPVFVLDTGALHTETLALLERLQAFSRTAVEVYPPQRAAVLNFVRHPGRGGAQSSKQRRVAVDKPRPQCGRTLASARAKPGFRCAVPRCRAQTRGWAAASG